MRSTLATLLVALFIAVTLYLQTYQLDEHQTSISRASSGMLEEVPLETVADDQVRARCAEDDAYTECGESLAKFPFPNSFSQSSNTASIALIAPEGWKLSTSLLEQLNQLETLAREGSVHAAYILAQNLTYCFYSPVDEQSYQTRVNRALDNNEDDRFLVNLNEKYEYCQGVNQTYKNQFVEYLERAAKSGNVNAMVDYGVAHTELLVKIKSETESTLNARTQVLAAQQKYLKVAAQHGNVKAIARLADDLWRQKFGHNDGVRALAYLYLVLELTTDSQIYSRYEWLEQRMIERLSLIEVEQARELTRKLKSELKTP
ncbi:hypothetical protein DXX93_00880 [Thalassotalea euphylliae]|uniref:Sel1 repeat family protein n=1 Tax=Thalassotalea euphylliae TaxID=1655234 RepID=A0A3E0TL25_9GAMM|nr:hypothetical protein [Thalassotalea euphylliae]REL25254.1 hypothetical protein DXX93_00880 [Thalassotalea euphylliae]